MQKWELVIFLSNACNLSCKHCDIPQEPKHSLDREQLEILANYGPYKVNFLGGEPLVAENLEDAFEVFGDRPITVSTNGQLVPKHIELLQKARGVILSLEGTKKSTDAIRGKGVFKQVVESAELLRKSGVEVTLRCSVWDENLRDVPNLIKLAKRLDTGLMFFPMLGAAPLNPQGQAWLFRQLDAYDRAWVDQPHYFCFLGKEAKCPAGWHRLAVDWNGDLYPCVDGETLITLGDGTLRRVKDLKVPQRIFSCDTNHFTLKISDCLAIRHVNKSSLRIRTRNDELIVSLNHPFFKLSESKLIPVPALELKKGDFVAVSKQIPHAGKPQPLPRFKSSNFNLYKLTKAGTELLKAKLNGISQREINEKTGINRQTIRNILSNRPAKYSSIKRLFIFVDLELGREYLTLPESKITLPQETTNDFCMLLGYFIGDGYANAVTDVIGFSETSIEVAEFYKSLLEKVFNAHPKLRREGKRFRLRVHHRPLARFLAEITGGREKTPRSPNRSIPEFVHRCSSTQITMFFRGLYDAEGSVISGKRARVNLSSASLELLSHAKLLLLRLGIQTSNPIKEGGVGEGWRIDIRKRDIAKFRELIGFRCLEKMKRLNSIGTCQARLYPIYQQIRGIVKEAGIPVSKYGLGTLQRIAIREGRARNILARIENDFGKLYGKRRYTDENLVRYYNKKLSDGQIAKILHVNPESVRQRRIKLGLKPNYIGSKRAPWAGEVQLGLREKIRKAVNELLHLIDSDVGFDKIVSVVPFAVSEVYDLETNPTHTFLANSFVVHNCQWLRSYYLGKVGDPFDLIKRNAETFVKTFKTCPTKCFGCEFMDSCAGSCRVSMSYTNCPLLPQGHSFRPELLERAPMGKKLETLRTFLRGVVSC